MQHVFVDPIVLEVAAAALGVPLSSPERLDSPNLVFRASAGELGTVVVKRVTMTEWNRGDGDESEQLLNEWCVLEHLGGQVAPILLAVDREASLIVLEDLGDRPTLEKALLDELTIDAREMLSAAGSSLAIMHGAGVGRESEFLALQRRRATLSPRSDSTVDFRAERRDWFEEAFDVMGVRVHDRFWVEVSRLEEAIHDGALFRTLIHADAGPQNFLVGDDMRMIDFEFGVYLNAMCDVGGARVGFPQTSGTRSVVPVDAKLFEDAYRQVAVEFWPEVGDDDVFAEHLMFGAGHWALNRLAGGWRSSLRDMVTGASTREGDEVERSHYATLWTSFCDSADQADVLGPISATLRSALMRFQERFADMVPLAPYAALED
jgi:Phosphotransferase enzyme family